LYRIGLRFFDLRAKKYETGIKNCCNLWRSVIGKDAGARAEAPLERKAIMSFEIRSAVGLDDEECVYLVCV
jgi:hypothetical protein